METPPRKSRVLTLLCAAVLFACNAYVARSLFKVDFTQRMESVEGSYISISRWAIDHWHDRLWFPLWFGGSPFARVYQPGLHLSVAEMARLLSWSPERAYHFLTGLAYAIGPVFLFWLCYRATSRRAFAFLAGLAYSLFSTIVILAPAVRVDLGGPLLPRRYQVLVHYGEGPHTSALALLPLVIWLLDRAITTRYWAFVLGAPLAVAAVVVTNWPGTMGLAMAVAAYALAMLDRHGIRRWLVFAGVGFVAYLLVMPWASFSILRLVLSNAQQSVGAPLNLERALFFGLLGLVLIGMHFGLKRLGADQWLRFFLYFALITGPLVLSSHWFRWQPIAQSNRFESEFDMAASVLLAFAATALGSRLSARWRMISVAVLVVLCASQLLRYRRYAAAITQPLDITTTIEYRMAKWFDQNMHGRPVFAPGNVSLWMNLFTDVPQLAGCCDQGVPTPERRIAVYTVYTGPPINPNRDAELSLVWLKAYGAAAIGVTGPQSTEVFKPYRHPRKFDGVLPELWRSGDNVVYGIPHRSDSLAHVVNESAIVTRAPLHGMMIEPMLPLLAALDREPAPFARLQWLNQHEAWIDAATGAGDVIFVQMTYAPGWQASDSSGPLKIAPDALGMMVISPGRPGAHHIRLVFIGDAEWLWARRAQIAGFLLLGLWTAVCWRTGRNRRDLPVKKIVRVS